LKTNLKRLKSKVKVNYIKRESDIPVIDAYDTVIDALYGTGFKGGLTGVAAALVSAINASKATVYSVDVPSGLDGGLAPVVPALAVNADVVFTFHAPKLAFLLPEFADFVRSFSGVGYWSIIREQSLSLNRSWIMLNIYG
jgi:NAD(P)H-hydrate repair Nnr-like enzyme with NAD(P)H-hydrate epimerase domain